MKHNYFSINFRKSLNLFSFPQLCFYNLFEKWEWTSFCQVINFELFLLSEEFGTMQMMGRLGKKTDMHGTHYPLSCCNFMHINPSKSPQNGTKNLGKGQSVRINSEG